MIGNRRVLAPPTLIEKYPDLKRFADSAQGAGENSGGQWSLLA